MAKPKMLHAIVDPSNEVGFSHDFVDCSIAFEGVRHEVVRGLSQFVIVWHDDLSLEEAVSLVEQSMTRSRIDVLFAQSIEGPMYARNEADPIAQMVNRAWREWNEVLN